MGGIYAADVLPVQRHGSYVPPASIVDVSNQYEMTHDHDTRVMRMSASEAKMSLGISDAILEETANYTHDEYTELMATLAGVELNKPLPLARMWQGGEGDCGRREKELLLGPSTKEASIRDEV